ncbi:MAG: dCMP deaminase family protein [archaeon]|jgi:dCMP deaminase
MVEKVESYRPSKEEYYWNIAKEVAQRSNCISTKVGAVIVKGDQIISTGYNGAPRGTKDCFERGGCLRRELGIPSGQRYEICRSVHAEQNALINAARAGTSVVGATMYQFLAKRAPEGDKFVKAGPCYICKKQLINAGIERFVGNDETGKLISFNVSDWINNWNTGDFLDKELLYNSNYSPDEFKYMSSKK